MTPTFDEQGEPQGDYPSPIRSRRSQWIYILLLIIGTIIAVLGWLPEWAHYAHSNVLFRYSTGITIAGHATQLIGAFGMLLTPDYAEEQDES